GLLIAAGEHDQTVEFFQRPTLLHEARRQVVQQLGVRRRFGAQAEVTGRAHEACAEMMQPNAIDQCASREGILGAGDGLSQFEPAAALLEWFAVRAGHDLRELTWNIRAAIAAVAANEN